MYPGLAAMPIYATPTGAIAPIMHVLPPALPPPQMAIGDMAGKSDDSAAYVQQLQSECKCHGSRSDSGSRLTTHDSRLKTQAHDSGS